MSKAVPLNCCRCGRFVGKDGSPDVFYDHYSGAWEVGYSRCVRCVHEDNIARSDDRRRSAAEPAGE